MTTTIPDPGDTIQLNNTTDPYTKLTPGDTGTVTHIRQAPPDEPGGDPIPQINIEWDNGSTLSLLAGIDDYTINP